MRLRLLGLGLLMIGVIITRIPLGILLNILGLLLIGSGISAIVIYPLIRNQQKNKPD